MYKINELIAMEGASFKITEITKEKWSFDYDQILIHVEAMYQENEYVFIKLRHVDFIREIKDENDSPISWNFPVAEPAPMPKNEIYKDKIIIYFPTKNSRKAILNIVNPVQFFSIIGEISSNAEKFQIELEI